MVDVDVEDNFSGILVEVLSMGLRDQLGRHFEEGNGSDIEV